MNLFLRVFYKIVGFFKKHTLKECGKSSSFHGSSYGHLNHVVIGNHSNIGPKNCFNTLIANVIVGDYVITGPEVMFISGNHRFNVIGKRIAEITNKEKETSDDLDIIIESDVWIGARATILKGVTIGRGSIVGACSVVTNDVPPYSIVAGNPARIIRRRFNDSEVLEHEQRLTK